MSATLIAIVGIIYAWVSVDQFVHDNPGMGIIFAGYSASNVGFWILAK